MIDRVVGKPLNNAKMPHSDKIEISYDRGNT